MNDRLLSLLHRKNFEVPGFNVVMVRREVSRLDRDPDNVRIGVNEFRILIEPV